MNLVVDTSVWSYYLRRPEVDESNRYVRAVLDHAEAGDTVLLVGVILQELLSGVRSARGFDELLRTLSVVPLVPMTRETYISAARLTNECQRRGVQVGVVDALITAACIQWGYPLLTADRDFIHIARHSELILLPPLG